jgi:hypothetical protein
MIPAKPLVVSTGPPTAMRSPWSTLRGGSSSSSTWPIPRMGWPICVAGWPRAKVRRVAIERPDRRVVDALRDAHVEVVVVEPLGEGVPYPVRDRGCDRSDADVLADYLCTNGHRRPSLQRTRRPQ